jgi:two-component system, cell cycle sensor histidine kinase and response regulator CckA
MKNSDFTLLFADDEPAIRAIYQKAFTRDGFKVVLCEDADQVLENLRQQKLDLLVLDLQMPGMDKMDLFAILREQYPDIPALVVSGIYKGVVDDFKARGYDTTTFFNKPASLIELKKSIFKLLKIDALGTFLTDKEVG